VVEPLAESDVPLFVEPDSPLDVVEPLVDVDVPLVPTLVVACVADVVLVA
jgi:hypothetical protein